MIHTLYRDKNTEERETVDKEFHLERRSRGEPREKGSHLTRFVPRASLLPLRKRKWRKRERYNVLGGRRLIRRALMRRRDNCTDVVLG